MASVECLSIYQVNGVSCDKLNKLRSCLNKASSPQLQEILEVYYLEMGKKLPLAQYSKQTQDRVWLPFKEKVRDADRQISTPQGQDPRSCLKLRLGDFAGDPVVKNLPSNAGDVSSTPGQGPKIPPAAGQLSPCASTREHTCCKLQSPHTLEPMCHSQREARVLQLRPNAAKKKLN